jgi:FAD/FMN-containing dehydrogenase/Fe-S oxidoreductase
LIIKTDILTRGIYATDASMYQQMPVGVVMPADREEILTVIKDCRSGRLPLVARGAGTSLTGQSINDAMVLDLSRHMTRIIELNLDEGWVRVEPGVVCSDLNAYLKPYGVHFAPDPATENRATIGGMIGNNSAGMRSVCYGMTIDHVLEIELALSDGQVLSLAQLDRDGVMSTCALRTVEGNIYRNLVEIVEKNSQEIRSRYPKVIRRSGGYALDALLDVNHWNLARLICGSEGTLGIVLEARLKLSPLPRHRALCLAHYSSIDGALRSAPLIVAAGASAAELLDGIIIRQARIHPLTRDICSQIQGDPEAVQVIEVQGDDMHIVHEQVTRLAEDLSRFTYAAPVMTARNDIAAVWQMRTSALGLMTTVRGSRKPTPYIEDAAVPPENLADYVAEVLAICKKHNQPVSLFGHSSVGLVHIRPRHDLHDPNDIATMRQIQAEVFAVVRKYGGSWSGEHGDGIVRGGFNREYFGPELYSAFEQVKSLFDPAGLMNPGRVIATPAMDSHLRFGPSYSAELAQERFRYPETGGIVAAAEQCTGVGACRKTQGGTMCPSYMATKDEMHSTRGRANALRLALSGQLEPGGLTGASLAEAMELCLACTGCKTECPNGVDMARLKAEVLQARIDRQGISIRTRLFSSLENLGQVACGPQARLINPLLNNPATRNFLEWSIGIAAKRALPAFAVGRLSKWSSKRPRKAIDGPRVLFFNESYSEYFLPQVGRAAIECLEAAGYRVDLATVGESQRVAISMGMLDKAKKNGYHVLKALDELLDPDTLIIVCEPSSASALLEDLPDLIDDSVLARRIADRVVMFDKFLEEGIAAGRVLLKWRETKPSYFMVHSHCHQKTVDGGNWTQKLLARIPGATVRDSEAGCCGMAGTFGYQKEHADLSLKIASQRLIPALDKAPENAIIVVNGFSCRHQISELTSRIPLHVAEVINGFIE